MSESDDWIEPPELLFVRVVLATSAAVAVPIAFGGVVTGSALDTAFLAVGAMLMLGAWRMRPDRAGSLRLAALAARLAAVVWLWLVLKIESPGNATVAWAWLAAAACLLSAHLLVRSASPGAVADDGDDDAHASAADSEGWIEELSA